LSLVFVFATVGASGGASDAKAAHLNKLASLLGAGAKPPIFTKKVPAELCRRWACDP